MDHDVFLRPTAACQFPSQKKGHQEPVPRLHARAGRSDDRGRRHRNLEQNICILQSLRGCPNDVIILLLSLLRRECANLFCNVGRTNRGEHLGSEDATSTSADGQTFSTSSVHCWKGCSDVQKWWVCSAKMFELPHRNYTGTKNPRRVMLVTGRTTLTKNMGCEGHRKYYFFQCHPAW